MRGTLPPTLTPCQQSSLMNNSLMIPSESNFCTIYHTPAPNLPLGDDHPFLPFNFSYFSRLTFLNIFNCIISQFTVIQHTHSKFLQVGTDGQHRLPLFLSWCIQCSDESLLIHFRSSAPVRLLLMLLSCKQHYVLEPHFLLKPCLCLGICFGHTFLYVFSCLGCHLPDPHIPCSLCLICLASQLFMNTRSTFTLMMSYSH